MRTISLRTLGLVVASLLLTSGCTGSEGGGTKKADAVDRAAGTAPVEVRRAAQPAPARTKPAAAKQRSPLRLEVNLKARKVSLFKGDKLLETHRVAVGSPQWPTKTGEWNVVQVVFNPEWIPPDESWAEEREPKKPGAPNNPLGRAQLVYDPPRTIHGTNEPQSIGKAVSHGSIRMANPEIIALAKRILAASGAPKDSAWFRHANTERTKKQIVDLPMPVPIRVF